MKRPIFNVKEGELGSVIEGRRASEGKLVRAIKKGGFVVALEDDGVICYRKSSAGDVERFTMSGDSTLIEEILAGLANSDLVSLETMLDSLVPGEGKIITPRRQPGRGAGEGKLVRAIEKDGFVFALEDDGVLIRYRKSLAGNVGRFVVDMLRADSAAILVELANSDLVSLETMLNNLVPGEITTPAQTRGKSGLRHSSPLPDDAGHEVTRPVTGEHRLIVGSLADYAQTSGEIAAVVVDALLKNPAALADAARKLVKPKTRLSKSDLTDAELNDPKIIRENVQFARANVQTRIDTLDEPEANKLRRARLIEKVDRDRRQKQFRPL